MKDPYSVNWNFGIQHSFGKNYTAEVNYVGTTGHALSFQDIPTWQASVTPTNFLPTYLQAPSQATLNALPNQLNTDALGLSIVGTRDPIVAAYSNAGFGSFPFITAFIPAGWSKYNGLETALTRRTSNGLTVRAAYTWSHTIDNSTADFHSTNLTLLFAKGRRTSSVSTRPDKANSALDRAQRLTLAMNYALPYFKAWKLVPANVMGPLEL